MQCYIVTVVILLLGMQLIPTWALQCYQCEGSPSTGCYDPFDSNGVPIVNSTTDWCVKGKGETGGLKRIARDAYVVNPLTTCTATKCTKIDIPGIASGLDCCCNTDLCNSTGRLSSTITLGIILSIFILAFKK